MPPNVFQHGSKSRVFLNNWDVSTYATASSLGEQATKLDTTTMGANSKQSQPGTMDDAPLSVSMLYPATGTLPDDLSAMFGSTVIATTCPFGATTGANVRMLMGYGDGKPRPTTRADIMKMDASVMTNGGVRYGKLLQLATLTSLGAASTPVDNAVATTSDWTVVIHVFDLQGASPNVQFRVQSSPKSGAVGTGTELWTAFTNPNITLPGAYMITGTGAVDRFARVVPALSSGSLTSITFAVSFARM